MKRGDACDAFGDSATRGGYYRMWEGVGKRGIMRQGESGGVGWSQEKRWGGPR